MYSQNIGRPNDEQLLGNQGEWPLFTFATVLGFLGMLLYKFWKVWGHMSGHVIKNEILLLFNGGNMWTKNAQNLLGKSVFQSCPKVRGER